MHTCTLILILFVYVCMMNQLMKLMLRVCSSVCYIERTNYCTGSEVYLMHSVAHIGYIEGGMRAQRGTEYRRLQIYLPIHNQILSSLVNY